MVAAWLATGFDDFVVERTIGRLLRGDVRGAVRVWTDLVTGFWGCLVLLLLLATVTVLLVGAVA